MLSNLEIPDDSDQLASWLERELCNERLADVVAELQLVAYPADKQALHLSDIIDAKTLSRILSDGLKAASVDQLHNLLNSPNQILALQEIVLEQGGDYWTLAIADQFPSERLNKSWIQLEKTLKSSSNAAASPFAASKTELIPTKIGRRFAFSLVTLTTAAMVFIAFFFVAQKLSNNSPRLWGLASSQVLALDQTEQVFLDLVADHLEHDWKQQRMKQPQLSQTLDELHQGCRALQTRLSFRIKMKSKCVLDIATAEKLLARCQTWEKKIATLRDSVASGMSSEEAGKSADDLIDSFVTALRKGLPAPAIPPA